MSENLHTPPAMSYGDYLGLDTLLASQNPRSDEHDELLFIIIHQASELWLKLSLHELGAAREHIRADDLGPAFKMIARVSRIQGQLIQSWDVLGTMTPSDYHALRPHLGQSSGFQSFQYRMLEFLMGAKDAAMLRVHEGTEVHAPLSRALAEPSLYDEAIGLLARRGFDVPPDVLERDWREPHREHPAVEAAWIVVYRDPDKYWDLYELAEKLVDLEFRFQQWRFAHLKTVERIIGFKGGTGGSAGAAYLAKALEGSFFPELFKVRTVL
ncbi:tryptophan 2,3-dioxygenase [Phenylobacterium sp.]|uniref:tryptophan 2,3-dioxygenase n=1 Tax=Phenylobacterium sp. TaxID=1871053 RepID=UPI0028966C7C|nr:tryptophan 2,3-dioxygenase [Phenylobacterium sp.]